MGRTSYWSRQRLGRRRVVQGGAAAGLGLAALSLTGCGGDDDEEAPAAATTTAASPAASGTPAAGSPSAQSTPAPKKGGKVTSSITTFPANFDIYATNDTNAHAAWGGHIYHKLLQPKGVPQTSPEYPSQEMAGDLASSWETPDKGTTYTFKVNPKAKWHAPLGRQVVAEDIVFAVNRFLGKTPSGKRAVNPDDLSMVDSVSAPDAQTVVFKLKAPTALFLFRLGDDYVLPVLPPEVEKDIDVTQTGVGSGPWMVDKVNRPTGFTLKRHPEWHHGPDKPYLDSREFVVIADAATALGQYKAKNTDVAPVVGLKDVPGIKSAIPDIIVQLGAGGTAMPYTSFSAVDPNSPWIKDPRIRRAFSMSIDRDALWEAFHPSAEYKAAGIEPPKIKWHNIVPVGLGPEWVDPQGSEISATTKESFVYAPDKAKALLSAAGFPDGLSTEFHYTAGYGPAFASHAELLQQMVSKGGFKLTAKVDDHNTVFVTKTFGGEFTGFAQIYQGFGTAMEWFNGMYMPGSSRNQGKIDDASLTAMIQKLNAELDTKARRAQVVQILDYLNTQMYYVPGMLGAGPNLLVGRPDIKGLFDYSTPRSGAGYYGASWWRA